MVSLLLNVPFVFFNSHCFLGWWMWRRWVWACLGRSRVEDEGNQRLTMINSPNPTLPLKNGNVRAGREKWKLAMMEKYLKQFVRRKTGQDIAVNYGKDCCSVKPTEIVSYCAIWFWCERSPTLWLMAKIKLGQNIQTEAHPNPTENWTNNDDNKVKCRLLRWWQG